MKLPCPLVSLIIIIRRTLSVFQCPFNACESITASTERLFGLDFFFCHHLIQVSTWHTERSVNHLKHCIFTCKTTNATSAFALNLSRGSGTHVGLCFTFCALNTSDKKKSCTKLAFCSCKTFALMVLAVFNSS